MSRIRATKGIDISSVTVQSELEEGLLSKMPVILPQKAMDYNKCTVAELRTELKQKNLSTVGRKQDLIVRLEEFDKSMVTTRTRERRKADVDVKENGSMTSQSSSAATSSSVSDIEKQRIQQERASIVIWRKPLLTIYYFILESIVLFQELLYKLWSLKRSVLFSVVCFLCILAIYHIEGAHQPFVDSVEKQVLWCAYWLGLGILSSVGLGTGLHTFLLYLGPHIASVTLAAFECMSVNFPEPPYPTEILCPTTGKQAHMSLWTIMSKVRLEAFMWGAGTALGELPPYFMARAARLHGQEVEEEEEIEELISEAEHHHRLGLIARAKIGMHNLVKRVGFWGILLAASIPNPLFDLAGITCGHFLVPFWTFFGATLIGKAVVKMHIQKLFVIFTFSERHVEHVIGLISYIPGVGKSLQSPFKEYLSKQKAKLHVAPGTAVPNDPSFLSQIFEKLVMAMVLFFIVSIINSMAQHYHKRCSTPPQQGNKQQPPRNKTSQD